MMGNVLNVKDRYEERKFIITSTIRMLAMIDFTEETLLDMYTVSKKLMKIESVDAVVNDDTIYEWFCKE
jgi:hypothetical protein